MKSLNEVRIVGNITADPEIKETASGTKVATFTIATNRKWKDSSGSEKEEAEFTAVVAWGYLAEIAEKFIEKWKPVHVSWRLRTRTWEHEDRKYFKTEVIADDLILLWTSPKSSAFPEDPGDETFE
jgi:single-strand DNA-binding protein